VKSQALQVGRLLGSKSTSGSTALPSVLIMSALLMLALATYYFSNAAWIAGKAVVAQRLLEHSWAQSLTTGQRLKPWPWADVSARARLIVPSAALSQIVLSDASGEAMAFGPGLVWGDPLQASRSTVALGGHRDTHLSFVEHLKAGDTLLLENRNGMIQRYRVKRKQLVDTRNQTIAISPDIAALVLITCYPFNALQTGGPLRMVATAIKDGAPLPSGEFGGASIALSPEPAA